MSAYAELIHSLDPGLNPAGAEAHMRVKYHTLDHLETETFQEEIELARQCEYLNPGYLRSIAESYGEAKAYALWETRRRGL